MSHFTPTCFQSGVAKIFILLGCCIPSLGLCCPQFWDHTSSNRAHYPGEWKSQQLLLLISSVCVCTDQSSLQGITLLLCIDVAHLVKKTSNSKYRVCVMEFSCKGHLNLALTKKFQYYLNRKRKNYVITSILWNITMCGMS